MYGLWLYKELKTEYGHCKAEVFRKGYTASAVEIGGFVGNSLNLALENLDTITAPIGKSVCSFAIYDTEQVEYDDLFTPDATAYKVVVSTKVDREEYNTRWSGYVTPDFFAENLSFRTPISISARDNIGYLNDVDFDLDTATITVRELIQAAFNRIAEDYPMNLSFVTQKQTAEGILAIDATISTALLREKTWYEALEMLLHDLGLQMRWVDNNTIAVLDISQLGENFGIQRFNFIERSGYREILPAWRELSQKQDYGLRENFFEGKMTTTELAFAKTQSLTVPDLGFRQDVRYYKPTNWGVARDIYTTDPSFYNSTFGNRLIFSAASETYPDTTYLSWNTNVLKSKVPLTVKCKALNSIIYPSGGTTPYPLQLKVYDPFLALGSKEGDHLQIGLRMNLFLHTRDNKTYVMNKEWVEDNGTGSGTYINMTLDKVSLDAYNVIEGKGAFPIGSQPQEQELTITANTIPYDGTLELRIYGYYVVSYQYAEENIQSPNFDKFFTYIDDLTYTFEGNDISSGQESKVQISELHNIKEDRDYSFGQVPLDCGGINAYAGGLFKANGDELVGFKRNADGSTYPLLELVGREIIHFNKRNYTKLSGTVKNLANEPLMFNQLLVYKSRNYLPFACSLDVISNTMNITTMQEVEPYMTHSFVEIKSELVTGGGATVSGGNNTALQYSAEVGNAKRISELNNASESEKKESYIVIDNAAWNESKKVPLSEMEGLDAEQVEEYLTENKYAKQSWVKDITDDLEADVANRVLIEDFEKLQDSVVDNTTNIGKVSTIVSTLEGYFTNGKANDAAKLGGKQPSHYATASALATAEDNLSKLTTRVTTVENNLSNVTGRVDVAEETIKTHTDSIAKNVADIVANATAISTNATNITKVSNRVAKLEGMWYIDDNGNLHTTYTIVSDKDGIFGEGGTSGGGSTSGGLGSVTIRTASGQEYKTNANGVVTIPDYQPKGNYLTAVPSGYATEIWVGDNYQPKGNYLTVIPTEYITESELAAKGYLTGITSAMVTTALGYVPFNSTSFTKATIKSTLGIADWALAASKPTYTFSEITSKPTTLSGYGITDAISTSGGTIAQDSIAFPLIIKGTSAQTGVILKDASGTNKGAVSWESGVGTYIYNYASAAYIGVKDDGTPHYKGNTLIHSGNYADTTDKRYLQLGGGTISKSSYVPLVIQNTASDLSTILYKGTSGDLGYLGFNGASNPIYMAPSGYAYTLYHTGNFNPANYLPLSGGTIGYGVSGVALTIDRASTNPTTIKFASNGSLLGYIGFDTEKNAIVNVNSGIYTLIHSGNIGSYNAGSANYLSKSYANEDVNYPKGSGVKMIYSQVSGTNSPIYTSGLSVSTDYSGWQLVAYANPTEKPNPFFRTIDSSNSYPTGWRQLAFLDDNVASATKLQTARTIWGQSFDGTGNVSGGLADVTSILFNTANGIGIYRGSVYSSALTATDIAINGGKIVLNPTGNVLVGTTTDNGYKLQIQGDGYASAGFRAGAAFYTNGDYGIWNGGRYTAALTNNDIVYYANIHSFQGGNVLIGTTTDNGGRLQVNGSIAITDTTGSSTTSNRLIFVRNTCTDDYWDFGLYAQSTKGLTFYQSSKGVNTDIGNLDGYGNFVANGSGTFGSDINSAGTIYGTIDGVFGSDARHKAVQQNLDVSLETIAKAPVFTYRWTHIEDKGLHLGTTAQYWLNTPFRAAVNTDDPDFYHLNYGGLGVAIGVINAREQMKIKSRVEMLEEEVRQLKNELNTLRQWHN